jgi:large subunit ribosomal protein L6
MVIEMTTIENMKLNVKIPDNVKVTIDNNIIHVKGEKGELTKYFSHPKIEIKINNNVLEIHCRDIRRKEKAIMGTISAHINNMIKGVTKGFEYKMKTVYSHFPIKTVVEGNRFIIQNFLGERSPRSVEILPGVTVEIKGEYVTLKGIDKEKLGQTAANIERATKVKNRDIRIFQDGVYLVSTGD